MSTQLEQIHRTRAELEKELRHLEEKERNLGASIKVTEEKRAVQELEEKLKAKRAIVEQLESRKRNLENRLNEPHSPKT